MMVQFKPLCLQEIYVCLVDGGCMQSLQTEIRIADRDRDNEIGAERHAVVGMLRDSEGKNQP